MPYSFEGRIRSSEVGEDGCLTLPGVLNYFQDCATFQSESIAQGVAELKKRKRVWLLSFWQIEIGRYPCLGEMVVTTTWPYDFKRFLGFRNFTMETPEGERLAWANSIWTYLDLEKGIPAKLTEADLAGYEKTEKLDMAYTPRKIALPDQMQKEAAFQIQRHHLDTNHHVNNGQYLSLAVEYLPEGFEIRQLRIEYKKQVFLGDFLYPEIFCSDEQVLVNFCDKAGESCSIIEFTRG